MTRLGATCIENSPLMRNLIIRHFIEDAPPVSQLLRDEDALEACVDHMFDEPRLHSPWTKPSEFPPLARSRSLSFARGWTIS